MTKPPGYTYLSILRCSTLSCWRVPEDKVRFNQSLCLSLCLQKSWTRFDAQTSFCSARLRKARYSRYFDICTYVRVSGLQSFLVKSFSVQSFWLKFFGQCSACATCGPPSSCESHLLLYNYMYKWSEPYFSMHSKEDKVIGHVHPSYTCISRLIWIHTICKMYGVERVKSYYVQMDSHCD